MKTMRQVLKLVPLFFALLVLTSGCEHSKEAPDQASKRETPVVVPQEVADSWKAVKVATVDLTTGSEQVSIIDIGGEFSVPDSNLVVKVTHFLPAFVRDGQKITTASNQLDNPAVMIRVSEGAHEIYSGWLFGLYPEASGFRHTRYSFRLVGQVPAQKKG